MIYCGCPFFVDILPTSPNCALSIVILFPGNLFIKQAKNYLILSVFNCRSLKAYDNSVSSDESGARELSGYSGGEGEECKAYNYIDIVGFLLQSWSDATRDTKHKVYDENRK